MSDNNEFNNSVQNDNDMFHGDRNPNTTYQSGDNQNQSGTNSNGDYQPNNNWNQSGNQNQGGMNSNGDYQPNNNWNQSGNWNQNQSSNWNQGYMNPNGDYQSSNNWNQNGNWNQGGWNGQPQFNQMQNQPAKNTLGIVSMIMGIISIVLGCCCYSLSICLSLAAIICGIVSLKKKEATKGFAIAGIITGAVGMIVCIMFVAFEVYLRQTGIYDELLKQYEDMYLNEFGTDMPKDWKDYLE